MDEIRVCNCKGCREQRKNLEKHLNHPFYKEVDQFVSEIKMQQIEKGAVKYPEPFTPDSWSNDELAIHAMQEMRDGQVYITGMRDRMRKQESVIRKISCCFDDEGETIRESFFKIKRIIDNYYQKV